MRYGTGVRVLSLSLAVGLAACGSGEPRPPVAAPPPGSTPTPLASTVEPPAAAPSAEPVPAVTPAGLKPFEHAAPNPIPHVEIKFPIAEQQIVIPKAARYKVRLKVEDHPMRPDGAGVQLVLDDHPARLVHDVRPVELGSLVPEGEILEPGDHLLIAYAVDARGVSIKPPAPSTRGPLAVVHFWVGNPGPKPKRSESAPRIIHHAPRGTLNGASAADSAVFDVFLLGAEPGKNGAKLRVDIVGPDDRAKSSIELDRWQAQTVTGLASGDYRFDTALVVEGRSVATATRTITVNRDAPVPGAK